MKFFYELELNLFIFCMFFIDMVVNINNCIIIICLLFVNVYYISLYLVNKIGSLLLYKI